MYNLKHTFKHVVPTALKLVLITGSFYFIYLKLMVNNAVSKNEFYSSLALIFDSGFLFIAFILCLSLSNWLLEILKWQILVSTHQTISFKTAAKQCLSALTVSLLTPNRIGDYMAKALYYSKNQTKTILKLNAIGQFSQLFITLIFGGLGLLYLHFNVGFVASFNPALLLIFVGLMLLVIFMFKAQFYNHRAKQLYCAIKLSIMINTLLISLLRYLIFSHQFYSLMLVFNLQINYFMSMMAIFSMYFLASVVPTFSLFDWAIKGSVAVFVFSFLEVNALAILEISLLMWMLNFALPALWGSVFVFQFKTAKPIAQSS
ncbi:MAG: hypothetical protein COS42_00055 [Flavobacteriales bacterium CG03_land_8_20_14_0_80_35_15]|nr:MAG: hypothetical protein COV50_08255 [Flavobacteriales bacterium CG11_big_fil_rev_8_21_14_0_20_35_7]PIV19623.1 MAG: hypothetical protein COS42_00055 [Flavobacteriales bacterium CG03_land_8_20_14_0_80_35_15]